MKRILSLVLALGLIITCFAGCGKKDKRILYNVDLNDYVKLGKYKGIEIDKSSEDYENTFDAVIQSDVEQYGLFVTKKEGKIKNGDVVNIDYTGKKDGVAFEGGTDKAFDLEIGSGTFIDGFEEGLIGKKIGSTVDLNLKFPENYGNEELNGAKVVFTVKINYVTTKVAKEPEDFYMSLGYNSVDEYYADIEERTIAETLQATILEASKANDYPQADVEFLYTKYYEAFEINLENNYGVSVEDYLSSVGQTEQELKNELISQSVKPLMEMQMVWYAIFDKEEMELTAEDKEQTIKDIIKRDGDTSATKADVIENYGEYYIEMMTVSEKVFDIVKENAKIS